MHGTATQPLPITDPVHARIAALSREFLAADAARRDSIGEEIAALIAGRVTPLR